MDDKKDNPDLSMTEIAVLKCCSNEFEIGETILLNDSNFKIIELN